MRILIQRVKEASVTINEKVFSKIEQGLLIFVGIHNEDKPEQAAWLAKKAASLRVFEDNAQKMNLSIDQVGGEILVVSQFTLYGNCLAGRRPEFTQSAKGEPAEKLYNQFVEEIKTIYPKVQTGLFGADMQIQLNNDGPVTLLIEK